MAKTYHPINAVEYAKRYIKNMPLEDPTILTEIVNDAHCYMWAYAPWSWSVGSMPTFTLTANFSDYSVNIPTDFLYAFDAFLIDGLKVERELTTVSILPADVGFVGQPNYVYYFGTAGASGTGRVAPKPAQVTGTQTVIAKYKRTPTLYTPSTVYTGTMPFDDVYFNVYREGVLWKAYLYADDRRAGDANIDPKSGRVAFSGQRAVFEAALEIMKQREPQILANPFRVDQKEPK